MSAHFESAISRLRPTSERRARTTAVATLAAAQNGTSGARAGCRHAGRRATWATPRTGGQGSLGESHPRRPHWLSVLRTLAGASAGSQTITLHPGGVCEWAAAGQITMIGHATDWLDVSTSCDKYAWTRKTKFDACSAWIQYSAVPPNPLMILLASSAVRISAAALEKSTPSGGEYKTTVRGRARSAARSAVDAAHPAPHRRSDSCTTDARLDMSSSIDQSAGTGWSNNPAPTKVSVGPGHASRIDFQGPLDVPQAGTTTSRLVIASWVICQ
jgi:hypothetical protein